MASKVLLDCYGRVPEAHFLIYSFSGYATLLGSAFDQRPKSQDWTVFEPTDNLTIFNGRHSLKFAVLVYCDRNFYPSRDIQFALKYNF